MTDIFVIPLGRWASLVPWVLLLLRGGFSPYYRQACAGMRGQMYSTPELRDAESVPFVQSKKGKHHLLMTVGPPECSMRRILNGGDPRPSNRLRSTHRS
ncbi:hypothetical protein EDB92DRAFT_1614762 [Lactarius akahatsu]|uniref:Uncharacterized protein n=1 Tax=Lactarius akahatsu TaxID=416441 RepID=A0AAD4LCC0_9AGAM|nr:hypothetical protein EDB92DRAFT_1614762 [Lactarius akahatsu]